MIRDYEFHVFSATRDGEVSMQAIRVDRHTCLDDGGARTIARKLARQEQAPIDVAVVGSEDWADRYIGTASPKYPYTECKVTAWERLD